MMQDSKEAPPIGGDSADTATLLRKAGAKGVLCAKCNNLNRPGAQKCSHCESHLYIKCKDCGAHTERINSRCHECGHRLHKSTLEKMSSRTFRQNTRITPIQIGLLLIFAAVAFYCVVVVQHVPNLIP